MNGVEGAADRFGAEPVVLLRIGTETFAFAAGMVREIIDPIPATRVAGARGHVGHVVNVRGNVVPLADLRERFGMEPGSAGADTRYVVVETRLADEPVVVAVVADKVFEVTEIRSSDHRPVPRLGTRWRPDYVRSIVKCGDEFVLVPDLETILA
ncbi:chemotaxis protein CheW [Methylobacterium oryzihabitans]|uniref:Chemotaxis protein CheW n=1 Tax=Methylobacterium oryzihabitans TaxID=2499852 RepID=A0A437PHI3_9HYPH|nr:chemotaxis protein CheW [Methylobacterium oryzihabitans]RVU21722.1 chemotaxis protein CheW [Methylobacterium oryzihabitans]